MSEETTRGHGVRGPLRRDRRSKVIAGVCGGLGRHLDIDPVVFRILFAVLSFVGGIGLLAYAAAWLFVPQGGTDRSAAHRMLTGSNPLLAVAVAIGLGLGALASISALTQGVTNGWPVWLIGAAVVGVLVWRGDIRLGRSESVRAPEQAPTWWQQPVGAADGSQGTTTVGGEPSAEAGFEGAGPRDAAPPGFEGEAEGAEQATPWVDLSMLGAGYRGQRVHEATPEQRPRQRAYGGLVLAILLAATGVLGVLDAAGLISLSWLSGGALVLLLLGAGMVVGGAFGKTTGLVPIGLVLAVPLITLSAVGVPLHGTIGQETWSPASAAAVQPSYKLAIGDGTLDLSNAAPGAGKTLEVDVKVGIGDLDVQVPRDVNVTVNEHVGIGTVGEGLQAPADQYGTVRGSGIGVTKDFTIAAQGKAKGTLVLDLKAGIGDVDVEAAN
jgi:phage shock protein PspC (stress-responsive transcriptional regulator)